jgi:hypothetical protein
VYQGGSTFDGRQWACYYKDQEVDSWPHRTGRSHSSPPGCGAGCRILGDITSPLSTARRFPWIYRTKLTQSVAVTAGIAGAGLAIGAAAMGAFAIGALAIGALAVRKVAIRNKRVEKLNVGELTVDRLLIKDSANRE